jgi:hypothetical protein
MSWARVDAQLAQHKELLTSEVKLDSETCLRLATTIAAETRFLTRSAKQEIAEASPVSASERLTELKAFQLWMDMAGSVRDPVVTRAQFITQNYVCFVYLPEACFTVVRKHAPPGSATRKCATFLTDNPVRAFRNAVAHANWQYRSDFAALVYWARKGSDSAEPLSRFEVDHKMLEFWQALARCVAYSVYENLTL